MNGFILGYNCSRTPGQCFFVGELITSVYDLNENYALTDLFANDLTCLRMGCGFIF